MKQLARHTGMTLIEILAGLVILSILALVTLRYLGVSVTAGGNALDDMRQSDAAASVMERITVDYTRRLNLEANPLDGLKSAVGNEGSSQDNAFGSYEVVENSYIGFDGAGHEVAAAGARNTLKVKIRVGHRTLVALFTD
jgi:prepilin-type N-terminal cleavage/methylation domain-containing protein